MGEIVSDSDSGIEDSGERVPGQIGRPSARVKTAAEMLSNSVGVIGIALCGEEAEPKKHHKESMQEGFEDYMTAKGWDSVPPWIGLAVALGAYLVFCLMTPRGKEFTQGIFNKGKKAGNSNDGAQVHQSQVNQSPTPSPALIPGTLTLSNPQNKFGPTFPSSN